MLTLFGAAAPRALAAAPMARTQPGYYRMMLGAFEITALNDGVIPYPTARVLPTATPEEIDRGLRAAGLTDPVGMSYNAFLINTGARLILIDTGTGGKLDDTPEFHGAGRLLTNLRAAGYRPDEIDEVYITHRGQDHIGGLTRDRHARSFPNAIVRASKAEIAVFFDPAVTAKAMARSTNKAAAAAWIKFTQDLFEPYMKAGKFQPIDGDGRAVPGNSRPGDVRTHARPHLFRGGEQGTDADCAGRSRAHGRAAVRQPVAPAATTTAIPRRPRLSAFASSNWRPTKTIGSPADTWPFPASATWGRRATTSSGRRRLSPCRNKVRSVLAQTETDLPRVIYRITNPRQIIID